MSTHRSQLKSNRKNNYIEELILNKNDELILNENDELKRTLIRKLDNEFGLYHSHSIYYIVSLKLGYIFREFPFARRNFSYKKDGCIKYILKCKYLMADKNWYDKRRKIYVEKMKEYINAYEELIHYRRYLNSRR